VFGFDDRFHAAEQRLKRIKELLEKMAYDFGPVRKFTV
jgi:hypothetical protein